MPILDPSLQYSLASFKSPTSKTNIKFFLTYLQIASKNIYRNLNTIKASIQFKKDLKESVDIINSQYKCIFCDKDFDNSTIRNYYQYLYYHISLKFKTKIKYSLKRYYYTYNGNYYLNFCVPYSSSNHTWYLTDSSIATLVFRTGHESQIKMINLEIDIMRASGFTLVLCILIDPKNHEPINDFLFQVVQVQPFSEIHFNLEFSDTEDIAKYSDVLEAILLIAPNIQGYFYIYTPFFHDVSQFCNEQFKKLKNLHFCRVFCYSQSLKKSFKLINPSFSAIKPFAYCESGFELERIRIILCNVPLYKTDNSDKDIMPSETSGINLAYISPKDFNTWKNKRISVLFDDSIKNHRHIERFIDFEDIHLIRPDFNVEKTLYLTRTNKKTLSEIDKIMRKYANKMKKKKFQKEKIVSFLQKNKLLKALVYALYAYHFYNKSIDIVNNFSFYQSQIFTAYESSKVCIFQDSKDQNSGVVYQIETGEGKSCIIFLIAAVIALTKKKKKVHIASSNIFLSKRDYENSYHFFKKLGLISAVLLHSNELPKPDSNAKKMFYNEEFYTKESFQNSSKMNFSVCGINDYNESTGKKAKVVFSTFINFESLYLRMIEKCPALIEKYFKKCSLLVDEADSILIDELANGTVLSHPMNSNGRDILIYVYINKKRNKDAEIVLKEIKEKWPNCSDISIDDINQMYTEIDMIDNEVEFTNGKKYSIETFNVKRSEKSKKKVNTIKDSIENMKEFINIISKKSDKNHEMDKKYLSYKKIVPFDFERKGVLEPNTEFGGFIQQFIAIKEMINDKANEFMMIKDISMNYLYVSHPIFVKIYKGVCGFTGTIGNKFCKKILKEQYNLVTKKVSRNKPNCRIDLPIIICKDVNERNLMIVKDIMNFYHKSYPVLVIFKDLNEIEIVFKMLVSKGVTNINIFDGKNEKFKPDKIAGRIGAVSLGTNFCGRGTNIKKPAKPLHVIVSYYSSNDRIMTQAFGRTARQGRQGTTRVICLKEEYINYIEIFEKKEMDNVLENFKTNNDLQREYILKFRQNRKWIFDDVITKQKIKDEYLTIMRNSIINVNRINAVNVEFPLCMSVHTFLEIQSQKIFSLYNCPNCKYTWILFQRYIREMILESWSLFVDKAERSYYKEKYHSVTYKGYLEKECEKLYNLICQYIPDNVNENKEDYDIVPTFMHIFKHVLSTWENKILSSGPQNAFVRQKSDNERSIFSFGFRPFTLLSTSGAKINTFENPDEVNYFIIDPELKFLQKQPKGLKSIPLSITQRIDGLFNKICQKINQIIGSYIGLKFFLRRTLGGCEFGVCFDFDLDNSETDDQNCIIDKDPLFVFTINVKSLVPLLAGILIIVLVYVVSLCKSIIEWVGASAFKLSKELIKATFKLVIKELCSKLVGQEIEIALSKVISFLQGILTKQINKLKINKKNTKIINLFSVLSQLIQMKKFNIIGTECSNAFQYHFKKRKNAKAGKFLTSNLPIGEFIKVGILIVMCIASFLLNFSKHCSSIKYKATDAAKEYNEKQNPDAVLEKYDYTFHMEKIDKEFIFGKINENSDEYDVLKFAFHDIENAKIPSFIKRIYKSAFAECNKLECIEFKNDSNLISIDKYAFFHSSLKKIVIPASTVLIGEKAFYQCKNLCLIEFMPNSNLETIENDAFNDTKIEKIQLPEKVHSLKKGWCNGMKQLKYISVSTNNKYFSCNDNKSLFGKSDVNSDCFDVILFVCRDISEFIIPSFIKKIDSFCFADCIKLESIDFQKKSNLDIIEHHSFSNSSIESIKIPQSVKVIGEKAFSQCKKLKNIQFSKKSSISSFESQAFAFTSIENIIIPLSVEIIGEKCFYQCHNLKSITINQNSKLKIIEKEAFSGTSINQISISENVQELKEGWCNNTKKLENIFVSPNNEHYLSIKNKIIVEKSVDIMQNEFSVLTFACRDIENFTVPSYIKQINSFTFYDCLNLKSIQFSKNSELFLFGKSSLAFTSIESIVIPSSVMFINEECFFQCQKLKSIEFEKDSKLELIDKNAFSGTLIENISIPDNVKELREGWCSGMKNLKSISISPENKFYKSLINDEIVVGKSDELNMNYDILLFTCQNIKQCDIPSNIKRICPFAFANCHNLKKVNFDKNSELYLIENYAFFNSSIVDIEIPMNVKHIGEKSFSHCKYLKSVYFDENSQLRSIDVSAFNRSMFDSIIIPVNTTQIGECAFNNCTNLHTIEFLANEIYIGCNCFDYCINLEIVSFPNSTKIFFDSNNFCGIQKNISVYVCPNIKPYFSS